VGVLALYTGLILWRLFVRLDSLKYPLKTYGDMAERIFGKIARHVCTVLQSLQLLVNVRDALSLLLYLALIKRLGSHDLPLKRSSPIPNYQRKGMDSRNWQVTFTNCSLQLCFIVCIVIWAILGMVIGQIRTLKVIHCSFIAVISKSKVSFKFRTLVG
jgi:hypothetical protein